MEATLMLNPLQGFLSLILTELGSRLSIKSINLKKFYQP